MRKEGLYEESDMTEQSRCSWVGTVLMQGFAVQVALVGLRQSSSLSLSYRACRIVSGDLEESLGNMSEVM
jgi:hypothetical protein